jgi:hypothetical protein
MRCSASLSKPRNQTHGVARKGGASLFKETTMIELFRVTSTVKQYSGCKDVHFTWFRNEPAQGRPYSELTKNYQQGDFYSKGYIDELFTRDEAIALKEYLNRYNGSVNTIHRVDLPVPNNVAGVGTMAVGGGDDFYMLDKAKDYPLPFSVWGYFDLVGCELIDGSGVYHHRLMLVSSDGTVRQQTNEEAAGNDSRL